jgi:hypothetical protein
MREIWPIKTASERAGEMRAQRIVRRNAPGLYRCGDRQRAAGAPVYEPG